MSTNSPVFRVPKATDTVRILVPLDGSELAAKSLPVAESLCQALSAELTLISVSSPLVLPYGGVEPYIPGEIYLQAEAERTQAAKSYLASTAEKLRDRGIEVQTYLDFGDPASRVLDLAKQLHSSLIVMTTHGRTGLARFTLGSVADRVVRGGAAPVLLLRSFPTPSGESRLSHALIPLDGSLLAEAPVFSLVPRLAGTVLQTVTLMRVVDPNDAAEDRPLTEGYLNAVRQKLLGQLGAKNCDVNVLVRSNKNPATSILDATADEGCGLIIMATHGEAGIGRWALGGITDRVLRDGNTPLLLVHPPRKE